MISNMRKLMVVGILGIVIVLVVQLLIGLKNDFVEDSVLNLTTMTEVAGKHFKLEILECINELERVESLFVEDLEKQEILYLLLNCMQETEFDYLFYVDTNGVAYSQKDDSYEVGEFDFFDSEFEGEMVIEHLTDFFYDDIYMPIVIPIQYEGAIQGQLMGLLSMETLEYYMESDYVENGVFFLINYEGNIIVYKNEEDNNENQVQFIEYLEEEPIFNEEIGFYNAYLQKELLEKESGRLLLTLDEQIYHAAYYMTEFNDWYMIALVEEGDLLKQFIEERDIIIAGIIILFVVTVNFVVVYMRRTFSKYTKILEDMTYFDKLTGLPNEVKFQSDMKEVLFANPDQDYVITMFDVVDFKDINELYGFQVGDEVLCLLTERINKLPIDSGFFGKGTKDEFWCFDTVEGMNRILDNSEYFEHKMSVENDLIKDLNITLRYGAYYIESNDEATLKILENAKFAHSIARKNNQHVTVYNVDVKNKVMYEKHIINHQESALLNREFIVYLQPKYLLEQENIVGAEALVRWVQPNGEILNPVKFIPIFEKNGFVVVLDKYILEEVCKIIRNWIKTGIVPVKVSVNFSRRHLENMEFVNEILAIIERYEVPKEYIELELTETIVSENEDQLIRVLNEVHEKGLTIAIDDFGSGYSSLGILRKMKFDVVKLDRSFLWDYENEERSKKIIKRVIDLAKDLNAEIVAEGVEREEDVVFLKEVACDMVQGYFFAKPMIHHEFTEILLNKDK